MSVIDTEDYCDTCAEPGTCECDDPEQCWTCNGTGEYILEHCCACGGSPYCQCCRACGASCVGSCRCPVTVTLNDGSTKTLPPAHDDEVDVEA